MEVTVLKTSYCIVMAEEVKDVRWLDQNGYYPLGEDFYQIIFKDYDAFIEEVKYLEDYGVTYLDDQSDESAAKVIEALKAENALD